MKKNLNKRGFTLIELLAIIIILGIIALIAFPSIIEIINSSKEDSLKEQKRTIVRSGQRWGTDNTENLPLKSCDITISYLKSEGYLASDKSVIDPTTGKEMTGCVRVSFDSSNNQYKYEYVDECKEECSKEKLYINFN